MGEMSKALEDHLRKNSRHRKPMQHKESNEQEHFVLYVRTRWTKIPMWVSPIFKFSGTPLQRLKQGARMKRMGYTPGTPDVTFLVNRRGYSGLVLEFKIPGEKPTESQEEILQHCRDNHKFTAVVYSCDEAIRVFDWYMSGSF